MDKDSSRSSSSSRSGSRRKKAAFSPAIKLVKQKSHDNLTVPTGSSSNSIIRRRKTDFDAQSMTWTTVAATDFVTPYLRLKVRNRRLRHLHTCNRLGDTLSPSPTYSFSGSFIKSSQSMFAEPVRQRSPKEVKLICVKEAPL